MAGALAPNLALHATTENGVGEIGRSSKLRLYANIITNSRQYSQCPYHFAASLLQHATFVPAAKPQTLNNQAASNVRLVIFRYQEIQVAEYVRLLMAWLLVPQEPKIASTAGQALGQTLLPTPASSVNLESIRLVEVTSAPNVMLAKSQKKGPRVARRASLVLSLTQVVPSA